MKKLNTYILIISTVKLVGCYYYEQMSPDSYDFENQRDIIITTEDTLLNLKSEDYTVVEDNIIVRAEKTIDTRTKLKYNLIIPIETVETIEVKKTDTGNTVITIGIITLVSFGIAFFISLSSMDW